MSRGSCGWIPFRSALPNKVKKLRSLAATSPEPSEQPARRLARAAPGSFLLWLLGAARGALRIGLAAHQAAPEQLVIRSGVDAVLGREVHPPGLDAPPRRGVGRQQRRRDDGSLWDRELRGREQARSGGLERPAGPAE